MRSQGDDYPVSDRSIDVQLISLWKKLGIVELIQRPSGV
jgi:hypothetical protein